VFANSPDLQSQPELADLPQHDASEVCW